MNKVILQGNTGKDIELKYFDGGNCVGNVSLATTRTYKNKAGEKVNDTQWHNLVFRNKSAEAIAKYAAKGSQLLIEGELRYRSWQAQDGETKYRTEVNVLNFFFLKTVKPDEAQAAATGAAQPNSFVDELDEEEYDDLPF